MVTSTPKPSGKFSPELIGIIQRFRQVLEKSGIHCEQILLFGSQRWEKADEGSDVDLIVISSDWVRYSWRERLELLGIMAARILEPIQSQGFTPNEIEQRDVDPFWQHILDNEAALVYHVA